MLISMAAPSLVFLSILFIPGFLILRSLRFARTWALCCAPAISIGIITILGECFAVLGVKANPLTMLLPAAFVPLFTLTTIRSRHHEKVQDRPLPQLNGWAIITFVAMGIVIGNNLFVSRLPSLDALFQNYDLTQHLNTIRSFVESGRLSSIDVDYYLSAADQTVNPIDFGGSFYPSAWHATCALLVWMTGISVPAAINVSMFVFSSVVFPLGTAALLTFALRDLPRAAFLGAFVAVSFVSFPWCLLVFGPLYPNLAGFASVPSVICLFTSVIGMEGRIKPRLSLVAPFLIGALGIAFIHPNTVFTMAVILMPYLTQRIWRDARSRNFSKLQSLGLVSLFLAFCAAVWVGCFLSPIFQDIVTHTWPPFALAWQEIVNILTQTYTFYFFAEIAAQVLLGILVVIGFVRSLYESKTRWIPVSYTLACAICFACATNDQFLAHFLGGFWYCDAMRLASVAVLAAIPLAALGFDWVLEQTLTLLEIYNSRLGKKTRPKLVTTVLVTVFLVVNFMPAFDWPGVHMKVSDEEWTYMKSINADDQIRSVRTTFGDFRSIIKQEYLKQIPLDTQEQSFLDKVVKTIPEGELVLNNPMDGSFLAYGSDGLRVYYRDFTKFHNEGLDSEESKIIRKHLCEISRNNEVQRAVESTGAHYVLVMSEQFSAESFIALRNDYQNDEFSGISSITPDTPGFELVLQDGELALYKIVV